MVEIRLSGTDRLLWFEDQALHESGARRADPGGLGGPGGSRPCGGMSPAGRGWSRDLRRKLLIATLACMAAHLLLNAFVLGAALIPGTPLLCQGLFLLAAALTCEAFLLLRRPVSCCPRHHHGGGYLAWGMLLAVSPLLWVVARLAGVM